VTNQLPRALIDRLHQALVDRGYIDKWNYPVQAGNELSHYLKTGNVLSPDRNFLRPNPFSRYNSLSIDDTFDLFYPSFVEFAQELVATLIDGLDAFLVSLKAQIQTTHARAIYANGKPREDLARQIVSAALFGYLKGEGFVYHEVPSGMGLIDILVCSDREIVVEVKLHSSFDPRSRQLQEYVQAGRNRRGYYFVFDTTRSFTLRTFCDIEMDRFPPTGPYAVIVCHVNPPRPSDV
jgi:hypothetical protein